MRPLIPKRLHSRSASKHKAKTCGIMVLSVCLSACLPACPSLPLSHTHSLSLSLTLSLTFSFSLSLSPSVSLSLLYLTHSLSLSVFLSFFCSLPLFDNWGEKLKKKIDLLPNPWEVRQKSPKYEPCILFPSPSYNSHTWPILNQFRFHFEVQTVSLAPWTLCSFNHSDTIVSDAK